VVVIIGVVCAVNKRVEFESDETVLLVWDDDDDDFAVNAHFNLDNQSIFIDVYNRKEKEVYLCS